MTAAGFVSTHYPFSTEINMGAQDCQAEGEYPISYHLRARVALTANT